MNNITKISIVTVSYNAVDTIEQTISSVVNQTYEDIEYIIIDGGSTDGTVDIIRKYEDRIAYWVSEPDKGIYDAMNKGIDVATGDYIYFLGADDRLIDSKIISTVIDDITPEIDMFSAPVIMVDYENNLQCIFNNIDNPTMPHQGFLVKCDIAEKYKFDLTYRCAADREFILKCVRNNLHMKKVNYPLAYYAVGGFSTNNPVAYQEWSRLCREYCLDDKYIPINPHRKSEIIKSTVKKLAKYIGMYSWIMCKFSVWTEYKK